MRERLIAEGLTVHFDGVRAVDGVDLELEGGEVLGLIGPNGAGKTTLVNAITGFQPPMAGTVTVAGRDVTGLPPHRLARLGIARSFQTGHAFARLTVSENIEAGILANGTRRRVRRARVAELLELLDLSHRADVEAGALPHGEERRLEIARAAAMRPRFLLLDEPAAGLNEVEGDRLLAIIRELRDDLECGVLVIEHDMRVIMQLSERIHVLHHGQTLGVGAPHEIRRDASVIAAYLGPTDIEDPAPC